MQGGMDVSKFSISKRLLFAFVIATLAGTCLHFVYDSFPNAVTALFSPVNESIWEHLKLIYWPYLCAALLVTGKSGRGQRGGWYFTLLILSLVMLAVGYVYHISLSKSSVTFDIGLYVVLMALGFLLPGLLGVKAGRGGSVFFFVVLLGVLIVLFTFLPPDHILFSDLSSVHTWYTIPY